MDEDEEDLRDSEERGGLIRAQKPQWTNWVRDGNLDLILPLIVLACLSIGVVVYNVFLRSQFDPCDLNRPLAKHFYCYNASKPPGFHIDSHLVPSGALVVKR